MRLLMKAAAIYQFETERHGLKSMIAYGKKRMFDGNFRDARTLLVFQTTGVMQWIVFGRNVFYFEMNEEGVKIRVCSFYMFIRITDEKGNSVDIDKTETDINVPWIPFSKFEGLCWFLPRLLSINGSLTRRGRYLRASNTTRALYATISKQYYKNIAAYIARILLETLDDERWY